MSGARAGIFLMLAAGAAYLYMQNQPAQEPATITTAQASDVAQNAIGAGLLGAGLGALTSATGFDFSSLYETAPTANQLNGVTTMTNVSGKLSPQQVYSLAQQLIAQYGFNATPEMATSIAIVESGDVLHPLNGCNPNASRYESKLNDSSQGLMQVLTSTAHWLNSIGYDAYDGNNLYDATQGMYFGLAYLDYLASYKGMARDEGFIVQSYNAGPGGSSTGYFAKYVEAKSWLELNMGLGV